MRCAPHFRFAAACCAIATVAATAAATVMACSVDTFDFEPYDSREQAIYYGTPDTERDAVVALSVGWALCSGTIIAVRGNSGYVLTAAHCLVDESNKALSPNSVTVGIGADFRAANGSFGAVEVLVHPDYNGISAGSANDFGIIRFSGASGSTPIIQAMTPSADRLEIGDLIDFVGYGITDNNDYNTQRRHIVKQITQLNSTWIVINQSGTSGGVCSGDSGGPGLTVDSERVASVTSFGFEGCKYVSNSGRVSTVYDSFIRPFVFEDNCGLDLTNEACDECSGAKCCAYKQACADNSVCAACAASDGADAACDTSAHYANWIACLNRDCPGECGTKELGCGFPSLAQDCRSCFKENCCETVRACALNEACEKCVTAEFRLATCSTHEIYKAFVACMSNDCASECDYDTGGSGGSSGGNGSGGGNTAGSGGDDWDDQNASGSGINADPSDEGSGCSTTGHASASPPWFICGVAIALAAVQRRKRWHYSSCAGALGAA